MRRADSRIPLLGYSPAMPSIDRSFVRRWWGATVAGIVLSVVALAGCSLSGASARATIASLSFSYQAFGKTGYIDQTLSINNDGRMSVVPTLVITALDNAGRDLPDVRVTTAFGSDQGSLVVQPGGGVDNCAGKRQGGRGEVLRWACRQPQGILLPIGLFLAVLATPDGLCGCQ